jgi:hypothetical protein
MYAPGVLAAQMGRQTPIVGASRVVCRVVQADDSSGSSAGSPTPEVARSSRPQLHVRTRHHAPETNGVVKHFNQTIKYEHLYRNEVPDVLALVDEAEAFRQLYNVIRPHEALDFGTLITVYLAHPGSHLSEPGSVQDP